MEQAGNATSALEGTDDSPFELTALLTIAYVAAMTLWVLTLSLASQLLSPVTLRSLDYVVAGLVARLSMNRRWRDAIWLAVATLLLLAAIGSTAGFRNMD